jgi:Ca2+/Na+ antiporter
VQNETLAPTTDEIHPPGEARKFRLWQIAYLTGFAIVIGLFLLEFIGIHIEEVPLALAELIGGILLIAGACEAFVISVEGIAHNYNMTDYVSGIYASLASTIPELSVITFLLIRGQYEMAWVLALATIFMNSLVFALYTLFLPKDKNGNYKLPDAIMWVGSDLLSMGAVISLSVGLSMLMVFVFAIENPLLPRALDATELFVFGGALLGVFVAYLYRITKYYGKSDDVTDPRIEGHVHHDVLSRKALGIYLFLASAGALLGGEALSGFADFATETLHLSFIHAALLLVLFGGTPEYIIVASSHRKEQLEVALSNAFGGIVQVFFVIFGFTLVAAGVSATLTGVTEVIPIDLFSVVLLFFAFPSMFILRVMITDDSHVNALESISMIAVFIMMLYILLMWGIFPIPTG